MRRDRDEKLDAPVVLVKWYDWTKWLLERVESFPKNRQLISVRQYGFACKGLTECGRMVGDWLKQAAAPAGDSS